ncbi:hypothetical protein YK48G_02120 [Lentilactobacillus fungorum]|uniref:Uncharacterized protein n=1 Tax=Lentilactobacillus fungorum TaxID=2201250 RepID=A0ABQ3VV74_9LACO|nr:hypothetical protein YK48G_02120 [Lentilactobacillus fungorum]
MSVLKTWLSFLKARPRILWAGRLFAIMNTTNSAKGHNYAKTATYQETANR